MNCTSILKLTIFYSFAGAEEDPNQDDDNEPVGIQPDGDPQQAQEENLKVEPEQGKLNWCLINLSR